MPPAAPAPGSPATSRPVAAAATRPKRPRARSSSATIAGVAPFCGPKTAEAPRGPVSGLSTSQATRTSAEAMRGSSPERSMRSSRARAAPPSGRS